MALAFSRHLQWLLSTMGLAKPPPPPGGPMTREAARELVRWYLQTQGAGMSEGLNAQGFGGAMVGDAQLYFEHHEATQTLENTALVYRFRADPKLKLGDALVALVRSPYFVHRRTTSPE